MIKFELLSDSNLGLNEVLNQDLELSRVKKIIRAESKISQKYSNQNAEDLISFIEEHKGESLNLYQNENIKAIFFRDLNAFKIKNTLLRVSDRDSGKVISIVDKFLNQNIQDFIFELIKRNEWGKLNFLIKNYTFLITSSTDYLISEKFKTLFEDLRFLLESNNIPQNYNPKTKHFSEDNFFYKTLLEYSFIDYSDIYLFCASKSLLNLLKSKSKTHNVFHRKIFKKCRKHLSVNNNENTKNEKIFIFIMKYFYFLIPVIDNLINNEKWKKTIIYAVFFILILIVFLIYFFIKSLGMAIIISIGLMIYAHSRDDGSDKSEENKNQPKSKRKKIEDYIFQIIGGFMISPFVWLIILIFKYLFS